MELEKLKQRLLEAGLKYAERIKRGESTDKEIEQILDIQADIIELQDSIIADMDEALAICIKYRKDNEFDSWCHSDYVAKGNDNIAEGETIYQPEEDNNG